ncbi:hypothetical protein SA5211_0777 [Staphylococcus aureus subsp. aureus SA5211]|nr:hypothetical protein [Staphylococcus aureus subsp. aureus SA5211]
MPQTQQVQARANPIHKAHQHIQVSQQAKVNQHRHQRH